MNKKEFYRRLVGEITLIDVNRFSYSDSFRAGEVAGKIKGLESAKKLLNQLDEPELPAIPQFVADWIEEAKGRHHSLYQAMNEYCTAEMNQWIKGFFHSDTFARAWLDGYTIEKEKMYLIRFNENQYALKFNKSKIDSLLVIKEDAAEFTEEEIKAINERYWEFREEVQNEQ